MATPRDSDPAGTVGSSGGDSTTDLHPATAAAVVEEGSVRAVKETINQEDPKSISSSSSSRSRKRPAQDDDDEADITAAANVHTAATENPVTIAMGAEETGPSASVDRVDDTSTHQQDGIASSKEGHHLSAPLQPTDDSSSFGTPSTLSIGLSVDDADYDNDADSAMGSMIQSSSMSASSSVYEFVEEFGRTFHRYKEGKYFLPNDEQEIGRLDLQHRIALQVLDWKLYMAPIDRPNRVLDVGTGTGIWAIEFADQNPESDVLGTDLSPIQPEYVPANCRFEIDDAEDEWIYSSKFDYIHGRYMCAFLTDFPKLFTSIYDNLNPGGWVEFMETLIYFQSQDGTLEGTALQRWNKLIIEGVKNLGRNVLSCQRYKRWMLEAGFTNVEEHRFVVPANPWAKGRRNKELGALQMVNNLNGVYGLTMTVLTKGLGWANEEVEVLLADVRRDMSDKNIHAYITLYVVYGQRPH